MSFKPIMTQEDFDVAISERLKRQKESLIKEFSDYGALKEENKKLNSTISSLQIEVDKAKLSEEKINELTGKVNEYKIESLKVKYALEAGIPFKFANRISGATEEEIKSDAGSLAEMFKSSKPSAPLKNSEPMAETEDDHYRSMLKELEGE